MASQRYNYLLLLLIALFLLSPFWHDKIGRFIHDIFLFLAILAIIDAFHVKQKIHKVFYRILALFVLLLDTVIWFELVPKNFILICLNALIETGFLGIAIYMILKHIFFEDRVTQDTVKGGITVYLLMGIIFAILYRAIHLFSPQSFYLPFAAQDSTFDPFYFSFLTLTTVGYGDIVPISPLVRVLTNLEGINGILYPATIIARLVSLYIIHDNKR